MLLIICLGENDMKVLGAVILILYKFKNTCA